MKYRILRLLSVHIIELILKIIYIFPIKRNRILFMAFSGNQYSCSPKYIYQNMQKNHANKFEYIWAFNNVEPYRFLQKERAKVVRCHTIRFYYYMLTSKIVIMNTISGSFIPFRKQQYVINTWHGGGAYKRSGPFIEHMGSIDRYLVYRTSKKMTCFISSCSQFSEEFLKKGFHYKKQIIACGLPRNDIFWGDSRELVQDLKNKLGIPLDKRILLYAPTYRDDSKYQENVLDVQRVLECLHLKFGGDWVFLFRAHYFTSQWNILKSEKECMYDVTNYPDMQELLYLADVLISDYSSCIWDFSFTGNPIFLFAPDLNHYRELRDFFVPIEQWGFPISYSNDELIETIRAFNESLFQKSIDYHHQYFGSFEKGTATQVIVHYICSLCGYR